MCRRARHNFPSWGDKKRTQWKVEGSGAGAKIRGECPICHSVVTICGNDPMQVMRQRFKHRGCKGRLERIPINIRDEYLDRAVVSLT